jgi:deoxyribonuclease-4
LTDLPLGAHHSIAGGTPEAVTRAVATGCRVLQIFVKNSNRWDGKTISPEEAGHFRRAVAQAKLSSVVAHASYLINLAGEKKEFVDRSIEALVDELSRCDLLGVPALILHPGSSGESSASEGILRVARGLDQAFARRETTASILLETAAGQGASVGRTFEELRDILGASRNPQRVGICLDTCHVFAAGYELRTPEGFAGTLARFESALGLEKLRAIHVNDSKKEIGSRVDRHEHIGDGRIGMPGFRNLMREEKLHAIPKYLETPKDEALAWDRKNLAKLRRLARKAA